LQERKGGLLIAVSSARLADGNSITTI